MTPTDTGSNLAFHTMREARALLKSVVGVAALAACNAASPRATPTPASPAAAKPAPATSARTNQTPGISSGALSLAGEHGCAVTPGRELRCWGPNDAGQLGHGDFAEHWAAVAVKGLTNVARVAVGHTFACASLLDGSVWCWGDNASGQLGTTGSARSPVPVAVPGVRDAVAISVAGFGAACAVSKDERVTCWGVSSVLAKAADCHDDPECTERAGPGPTEMSSLRGSVDVALSMGGGCALQKDGGVKCWGNDFRDDEGLIGDLEPLVAIASGAVSQHACGIDRRGIAHCWGRPGFGQLDGRPFEPGQNAEFAVGKPLTMLGQVVAVATGTEHSCARTREGKIWCWGQAQRFATSKDDLNPRPRLVENFSGSLGLSAGWYRTCALDPNLRVSCWGELESRMFARNSARFPWQFRRVELTDAVDVGVGSAHSCAVLASGRVLCWGTNQLGELGAESPWRAYSPVEVPGIREAASITCAHAYCVATLRDEKLVGWGTMPLWGSQGPSPVTLLESEPSVQVALTEELSCRLLRSGRVRCFQTELPFPEKVSEIVAEGRQVCARTATGRVFCAIVSPGRPPSVRSIEKLPPVTKLHRFWKASDARGATYDFGSGTVIRAEAPVAEKTHWFAREFAGARKMVSGRAHACALFEDGSVGCQGEAWSGALGIGYQAPIPLTIDAAGGG